MSVLGYIVLGGKSCLLNSDRGATNFELGAFKLLGAARREVTSRFKLDMLQVTIIIIRKIGKFKKLP